MKLRVQFREEGLTDTVYNLGLAQSVNSSVMCRTLHVSATGLVDERLSSLQHSDDNLSEFILTCLLRNKDTSMQEIYSAMLDLLIAGTDTVRLFTFLSLFHIVSWCRF